MAFRTGRTIFVFARRLMPRLGKILVPASAASPLRHKYALAGSGKIGNRCAGLVVKSNCAEGNLQDHVLAGVPGAVGALAVTAAVGFEFAVVAVAKQRVVV